MDRREIFNLPNYLTALRIVLTPIFLLLLFADTWYWKSLAFVVFSAASLTDLYDGKLARAGNQETPLGRFLDPLADKILVTSALVALALNKMVNFWIVLPIVGRDILITGMRLYGLSRGEQMVTTRLAKWKTAAQLSTVLLILFVIGVEETVERFAANSSFFLDNELIQLLANVLLAGVLLLTLLSGFQYLFRATFSYKES
ncbi:MAG TPA: CDP-diacylglycerol--glycerol-3-phosphate 3-phosphatidyltransferase [Candidatus Handelsmanbacteria bacterium]|nr:CDP-diacylglycerol--glycerol-3-phosphate 3-phosphatidyltransferase [Candidatus Handelsmanbacteria bacterium]